MTWAARHGKHGKDTHTMTRAARSGEPYLADSPAQRLGLMRLRRFSVSIIVPDLPPTRSVVHRRVTVFQMSV
jgi:hypothetical protein